MNRMTQSFRVGCAARHQAAELEHIYRSVMIDRRTLNDLTAEGPRQQRARDQIKSFGGFINPPDPEDMQQSLHHGLVFICIQEDQVLGFNRIIIDPAVVMRRFKSEFHRGLSVTNEKPQFKNWSGHHVLNKKITLRKVHWVDTQLAETAWNAVQGAVNGAPSARLAWALDAAVLPQGRGGGLSKAMVDVMRDKIGASYPYRAFRIFEILEANGIRVAQENVPSNRVFTNQLTRQFAYLDTDIIIDQHLTLGVRWHQWVRTDPA